MFEKLDVFILDRIFQPIADWWNERTGKSCFWLAAKCGWVYLVCLSVGIVTLFMRSIGEWVLLVFLALLAIKTLWGITRYERLDRDKKVLEAIRVLNPQRLFFPYGFTRLMMLALVLLLYVPILFLFIIGGAFLLIIFLLTIVASYVGEDYFGACTPKPPSPLKAGNRLAAEPSRA